MRRAEAGFTLIELLIAFVIAAGGLTALFQLLSGNMAGMSRAQAREHATLIAQSRLAELQAGTGLTAGSLQGQADGRFSWAASVQPYGPALTDRQSRFTRSLSQFAGGRALHSSRSRSTRCILGFPQWHNHECCTL
jgi:general secretion pathway protein I